MGNLDIAPPAPPKFLKQKVDEEPKKSESKKKKLVETEELKFNKKESFKTFDEELELEDAKDKKEVEKIVATEKPKKKIFGGLFSKKSKSEPKDWSKGDIVEEYHEPKEETQWDKEDFISHESEPTIPPPTTEELFEQPIIPPPNKKESKKETKTSKRDKKITEKPSIMPKPDGLSEKIEPISEPIKETPIEELDDIAPLPEKTVSNKPSRRKDVIDMTKIPVKKTHKKKVSPAPERVIKRRNAVDKAINEYFKSVEKEQKIIEKELQQIVNNPKKGIKKSTEKYLIHHNEKLIRTMKHLLAAIKTIDDVKFERKVQANKKDFQKWINSILEKEKKAELQRNKILKTEVIKLFKEYSQGLNRDMDDKRYELSDLKKDADKRLMDASKRENQLESYSERLDKRNEQLKNKNLEVNNIIKEKVSNELAVKLKKDKAAIARTETRLKKLVDEYTEKWDQLKEGLEKFETDKIEAQELLESASVLLSGLGVPINITRSYSNTLSTGSGITLWALFTKEGKEFSQPIILGGDALGERGKKAEDVGRDAALELKKEIDSEAVVDKYLSDQLIPLLGLIGGCMKTSEITNHLKSNIYVSEKFLDKKFKIEGNKIFV